MPTPDLPAELWLQILSYHPSNVRTLIGVNRFLFELALDDIYKTVYFAWSKKLTVQRLQQMPQQESLARRVECLHIRPVFLPMQNQFKKSHNIGVFRRKVLLAIGRFRSHATAPFPAALKTFLQSSSFEVLGIAKESVKHCQNVQEIIIKFHTNFYKVTPAFISFIDSLWLPDSIGPNITKLSLGTSFPKIPIFLKPLFESSPTLANIREFHLFISDLYGPGEYIYPTHWDSAIQALLSFLTAFKDKLTVIVISCFHLSWSCTPVYAERPFFDNLPHIPQLKEFQFLPRVDETIIHRTGSVREFLSQHASSLEVLTVAFRSKFSRASHSLIFRDRFNLEDKSIPPLVLPKLHTFRVRLP